MSQSGSALSQFLNVRIQGPQRDGAARTARGKRGLIQWDGMGRFRVRQLGS